MSDRKDRISEVVAALPPLKSAKEAKEDFIEQLCEQGVRKPEELKNAIISFYSNSGKRLNSKEIYEIFLALADICTTCASTKYDYISPENDDLFREIRIASIWRHRRKESSIRVNEEILLIELVASKDSNVYYLLTHKNFGIDITDLAILLPAPFDGDSRRVYIRAAQELLELAQKCEYMQNS